MKRSILKEQILVVKPAVENVREIKKEVKAFTEGLNKELKSLRKGGDVFVGGSFAKGTLVKKDKYDIDVFVRFSWKYDDISSILEKALNRFSKKNKLRVEKIHGSRDYFRVYSDNWYFEVIPVTKIKHPKEERNVTDLSYFHVSYVKRRIKGLEDEVILAKAFCHAQKVYGAETYVRGFSGYGLELLIINYGSFMKMLKALIKVKKGERIVVDPGKHFKKKNDVFFELNEAKLHSPIILIDPTYKERNALASLSWETFEKFQKAAKKFIKNPGKSGFVKKKIEVDKLKKMAKDKKEFIHVRLKTDRQEGDIAGTKMKKFSEFLILEMKKYFKIVKDEFDYQDSKEADLYLVVESKGEIVQIGPPMHTKKLRKHIQAFKKEHKKTFVKHNTLHAKIKIDFTGREFVRRMARNKDQLDEMGIISLKVS